MVEQGRITYVHTWGHLRGKPRKVTRCLLIQEGVIRAEGISICNPKDQYKRKLGNMIACGRAWKALEEGSPIKGIIEGLEICLEYPPPSIMAKMQLEINKGGRTWI